MEIDKSLDEIIKSRPRQRRVPRRASARTQILGTSTTSPATRARAAANTTVKAAAATQSSPADKIIVSNLPIDVNEAQIKDLFNQTVGPLREVTLHYDHNGRSKGIASVHFQRKGDGTKAFQQYNNRLIDGKKPMKIEIVIAPAPVPLSARVTPATTTANGTAPRPRTRQTRRGRKERPAKSAADLDAEMEDYTATNVPTAVAAPAAAT